MLMDIHQPPAMQIPVLHLPVRVEAAVLLVPLPPPPPSFWGQYNEDLQPEEGEEVSCESFCSGCSVACWSGHRVMIAMASPYEKKRYPFSTAIRYDSSSLLRPASADTRNISEESGR